MQYATHSVATRTLKKVKVYNIRVFLHPAFGVHGDLWSLDIERISSESDFLKASTYQNTVRQIMICKLISLWYCSTAFYQPICYFSI